MVQLRAFRRLLHVLALAFCATAIVAISPASARSHHHGAGRHARAYHAGHHARRHHAHYRHRHLMRAARAERGAIDDNARVAPAEQAGFGSPNIVAEARRYLGGNPTSRASLWCARFMNMVLQHAGLRGTGSDMASSFAHYGQRVSGPKVGAIAVMKRRGGGHVGIITGVDARGNPIMISGNSHNRVREASVSRAHIYAYVMPTS